MTEQFEPVLALVCAASIKPSARRRVALVMAALQDKTGGDDFIAPIEQMAATLGISKGQAQKHVDALIAMGVVVKTNKPHSGSPADFPIYRFNVPRLRALEQRPECTGDLFSRPLRRYFLADDETDLYQLMAMELHGQPGQRCVQFFLDSNQGDVAYGWGPLQMLLLPSFAKGAWTGQLNPQHGAPAWAHSVNTAPETMEELRLWAQDVALGRAESGPALNNQPALPQGANDSDH